jgi:hypothetical protein
MKAVAYGGEAMSVTTAPVSDMLVTVKSRLLHRAMFAEKAGDREAARRHFLAAAHLELVLAHDYEEAGDLDLALRSRISSASCLWSGGEIAQGRQALETLQVNYPAQKTAIQEVVAELTRDYPPSAA